MFAQSPPTTGCRPVCVCVARQRVHKSVTANNFLGLPIICLSVLRRKGDQARIHFMGLFLDGRDDRGGPPGTLARQCVYYGVNWQPSPLHPNGQIHILQPVKRLDIMEYKFNWNFMHSPSRRQRGREGRGESATETLRTSLPLNKLC